MPSPLLKCRLENVDSTRNSEHRLAYTSSLPAFIVTKKPVVRSKGIFINEFHHLTKVVESMKVSNIRSGRMIKSRRMIWVGHVPCSGEMINI
jgi:hypothetical protein